MWKQEDKYKECCHNDGCESFDTCIECWDEFAERNPPMTNADRIRAMSDEELADWLARTQVANVEEALKIFEIPWEQAPWLKDEAKKECLEWLRQPAEVDNEQT